MGPFHNLSRSPAIFVISALGFDKLPTHRVIPELNNIRRFYTIQAALERKGFKSSEIDKIIGGNWVRLYTESLG